jgi:hypothetical protein
MQLVSSDLAFNLRVCFNLRVYLLQRKSRPVLTVFPEVVVVDEIVAHLLHFEEQVFTRHSLVLWHGYPLPILSKLIFERQSVFHHRRLKKDPVFAVESLGSIQSVRNQFDCRVEVHFEGELHDLLGQNVVFLEPPCVVGVLLFDVLGVIDEFFELVIVQQSMVVFCDFTVLTCLLFLVVVNIVQV